MARGGGAFSDEEIQLLRGLPAVANVTRNRITYADSFKQVCTIRYLTGESPTKIFREAGLPPDLIGYKRIERCVDRWKTSAIKSVTGSGNMSDSKGTSSSENVHNVMIYQSMSGDAETGTANFSMTGGKLTSSNGDQFYVTNTDCNITLSGVTLVNKDKDGKLLRVTGNSASHGWGTAGKNGAQVTFTADAQTMEGDMEVDTISTLDLTLKNNSTFTGTIQIVDNADGGTAVENNAVVTIEKGSKWVLTGDCTLTSLTNNGTIDFNGHTITLADGTVLKG